MKKTLLLLLLFFSIVRAGAQDFSNKGKDFWVVYSGHIDGTNSRMALYITSDVNASGTIEVNGVFRAFTVTANQVTTVQLTTSTTPSNTSAYNSQIEGIGTKKGIHIISDKPIVVYSHILNSARSGSTLVLPTNVLGKEYYTSTYKAVSTSGNRYCQFDVIATEDNTTVEIKPTAADANNIHPANTAFQVTLQQGDVYQYQSNEDLTGTNIKSISSGTGACKKIAVFSGSTWTTMGCSNATSGDNLYQQMFPYSSWGKTYYTAPFISRSYDIFRIIVQDPAEPVVVNGTALNLASLINNRFYEINTQGNNTARVITSAKPICVLQYMITQNCDGVNADPEMIALNAIEQTLNDITVMSARNNLTPPNTNISSHFLNIIYKTNTFSTLRVDGNTPTGTPVAIPGTNYSYIQENVTSSTTTNPTHRVVSDSGFICIAYGYGNVESYGYNAGTNVRDLLNFITPINPLNITNTPSACANTPFYFSITYPFEPLSLAWNFNGFQTPNVNISSPVHDTTYFVSGKQVWRYRLPTPYIYPTAGNYPVSITAGTSGSDGCGNLQTRDDTLYVFDPPVTKLGWTHSGCVSDTVYFKDSTNYSSGTFSYKWWWDFGDGTKDSIRNPKHKYSAPGIYTVRFALISNVGCLSDTSSRQIIVSDPPVAKFGISSPVCDGKPVTFSDSSIASAPSVLGKWYWDYGDGIKDTLSSNAGPTHTYTPWGNKTASLVVETTGGCKSFATFKTIYVGPNPRADFSLPTAVCLPTDSARFTDASTIADGSQAAFTYAWTFGDPTSGVNNASVIKNPAHYYISAGPFNIFLQVKSNVGCTHDTTKVLSTVYLQARAGFSVSPENCLGDTTYFTTSSTGSGNTITNWYWDFGDGSPVNTFQNPSHRYLVAGTFTIKHWVKTDKGCNSDTLSKQVVINPLPTASFTNSSPLCETKTVTFTSTSTANAGNLSLWKWDLGDGTLINQNSNTPLTHTYASAGTYTVTLAVETDKGCKSTLFSKQLIINAQPLPGFISPEVCLSDAFAQFVDTSKIASGAITTWSWNFGDPASGAQNISSLQNPQHRYNSIGNYTVTLIITSNNGCVATLTQTITVNGDIPVANFNPLNPGSLCANDSVAIQDASTVNFGSITKVVIYWDNVGAPTVFQQDDLPAPGKIYKYLYPNFQTPLTKVFTIRYRAYSGATCVNDRIKTVTVNAAPKVLFTAMPDVCLYATPFQITQANETGGVPGSFQFMGPGVTTGGLFTPANAGTGVHTIKYTYTSNAGCIDTASRTIRVLVPPVAKFGFTSPSCETKAVTFSDSSSTSTGAITTWSWDFGDGTPVVIRNSGAAFTHIFANAGTYSVKLTVTTADGCNSAVTTLPVKINPQPVVDFSLPKVCLPNASAQFNDLSTIADGTAGQFIYSWNFGDPASGTLNTSSLKNPTHVYSAAGPYTVTLTVTSNNGCVTSLSKTYNDIHPIPVAKFISNKTEICEKADINFTDQSNGVDTTIRSWLWNFGDGGNASAQNPTHTFNSAGSFNVQLTVTNNNGCVSAPATFAVKVHAYPVVNAGPDKNVLEGGNVLLEPVVSGTSLQFLWTPSLYLNNTTIKNPIVTGVADQLYTLTVTGAGNCTASDQVFVKILKFPVIPNTFTPNGDGINEKWVIQYLETYPGNRVQVFTRYGQLVFESKGYMKAWNGTYKGKSLPMGTYYYVVEPGNGRKPLTGYVTIIK